MNPNDELTRYVDYINRDPRCRKCEHWVETNQPEHCTWCGKPVFAILHRRLDGTVTPACKPCYKDGLDSQKYTGPSLDERYFWEKKVWKV